MKDFRRQAKTRAWHGLLLGLILVAGPTQAKEYTSLDAWRAQVDVTSVDAGTRALVQMSRSGDLAGVEDRVRWHLANAAASPSVHEPVLEAWATAMATEAPVAGLRPILDLLSGYAPVAQAGHPERATHPVPAFDIARGARGTLNRWDYEDARNDAGRHIRNGDRAWVTSLAGQVASPMHAQALAVALGAARPAQIEALREPLMILWQARPELARSAVAAAIVVGRAWPVAGALDGAGAARLAPDLSRVIATLPPKEGVWLLEQALMSAAPVIRSIALNELAGAGDVERVVAFLDDATLGSSAALALAQTAHGPALAKVASDPDVSLIMRRNAVLGLKLDRSPQGRAALGALAARNDTIGREIRAWIE